MTAPSPRSLRCPTWRCCRCTESSRDVTRGAVAADEEDEEGEGGEEGVAVVEDEEGVVDEEAGTATATTATTNIV